LNARFAKQCFQNPTNGKTFSTGRSILPEQLAAFGQAQSLHWCPLLGFRG
jgi:hypothetical protein